MKEKLLVLILTLPTILFAQTKGKPLNNQGASSKIATKSKAEKFEPITLYFVMLTKGTNRTQDSVTAALLQEQHMANINQLAATGKLVVAGPFTDDQNWRGIFILKANSQEEAEQLVKTDPAVAAGRLGYEIHPWMTGKNCLFK